jgi:hypothetical protein
MKTTNFNLTRYDADDGKVFDWVDLSEHTTEDENGNVIQEHLYVVTLFIGGNDSIDNYQEVDKPISEEESSEE